MSGKTRNKKRRRGGQPSMLQLRLTAAHKAEIIQVGAMIGIMDINQTIMQAVRTLREIALQQINAARSQRLAEEQKATETDGHNESATVEGPEDSSEPSEVVKEDS